MSTRKERRRASNNIRNTARKKLLPILLKRQKGLCHFCQTPIVKVGHIQKNYEIVQLTPQHITYLVDGVSITKAVGTIEHLKPLSQSRHMPNRPSNVVAACFTCNHGRA